MNLSLKKTGLLIILGALFLYSCKDANEILLEPDSNPDKISTNYTDTFSITSSQIVSDFAGTAAEIGGFNPMLFGQYMDENLGLVKAASYAEVTTSNAKIPTGALLKGFKIHLKLDYNIGPKTGTQKVYVQRLTELMDTIALTNREYSFSSAGPNPGAVINSETEIVLPTDKNVDLKLDEALGQEFLDFFVSTRSQQEFRTFFKGISVKGDENNTTVYGINPDSSRIILSYRMPTDTQDVNITFAFTRYHFNHIDRTSNPNLQSGTTMIQSSTGYYTKISFPSIAKLIEDGRKVALNKAFLEITPEELTNISPPPNLFLIQSGWNEDSLVLDSGGPGREIMFDTLTKVITKNLRTVQSGYLNDPQAYNENALNVGFNAETKKYKADITTYVEAILKNNNDGKYPTELILYPEAGGHAVNKHFSYTINPQNTTAIQSLNKDLSLNKALIQNNKIKIKIYYTLLD